MTVGNDESLSAWAAAISREWPVSAAEIMEMHRAIAFHGAKTWAIPWLIQELLRGKRIAFVSLETSRKRIAWYNDVLGIEDSKPIKLRRRTIDVPEVAALLLPKETSEAQHRQ